MKKEFYCVKPTNWHWIILITIILSLTSTVQALGQTGGEATTNELVNLGFENVRWTENDNERIYTIENNVYKANGVGIAKAIEIIQKMGIPTDKRCKVIVTNLDVPELSLTYQPTGKELTEEGVSEGWQTSYDIEGWNKIKRKKGKNSSRFKVDILIYPQLSYKNLIITQIYQALFTLNPAIEISLWQGMKLTGQIILPVYNDGYSIYQDKIHPGFITLSQRFRLPFNIKGKATIGYFNADRYGMDLMLFYPFKDERFSLEGRIGAVGIGYWDGFSLHYDKDLELTWTLGTNFYWPKYNTQFCLKGEKYLMGENGIKLEMTRHFRYASVGFYAVKAKDVKSNGGFRFQILLPPYKQKRQKFIPRISTSYNMGVAYNAGNEQYYYRQYRSEANENIMSNNSFNPYFIKSELLNNY
jgi:hypothetical protein